MYRKYIILRIICTILIITAGILPAPISTFAYAKGTDSPIQKNGVEISIKAIVQDINAIIKLGGRAGPLYPTNHNFVFNDNLSFVKAMSSWNSHRWDESVKRFKIHLEKYPDSPWAAEATLHLGCHAQYTGDYTTAIEKFTNVIDDYYGTPISLSAKQRLGGVYFLEDNLQTALDTFRELKEEGTTWQQKVYSRYWMKKIARQIKTRWQYAQCGTKSLGIVLVMNGKKNEAIKVSTLESKDETGFSLAELSDISKRHGLEAYGSSTDYEELKKIKKPLIAHMDNRHFVVVENVYNNKVEIIDPNEGKKTYTKKEFQKKWTGNILAFDKNAQNRGYILSKLEMDKIKGGCCGNPIPQDDLGKCPKNAKMAGGGCCGPGGMPEVMFNMVSLNMVVTDTPLYYKPGIGPEVAIELTYNSDDSETTPFGSKWSFNYNSSYIENPGGDSITITMPDGRKDTYTRNSDGSYNAPIGYYNTLVNNGSGNLTLLLENKTRYHYNPQQKLSAIEDRYGNRLSFFYDQNGNLDRMTDASGRITDFQVDGNGRITQITDPIGRTAHFMYNANNNLIQVIDMAGFSSSYTYNNQNDITSITTPTGTTNFTYIYQDHSGWGEYPPIARTSDENFHIIKTDPLGNKTEYYWDGYYSHTRITENIIEIHDGEHTDNFIDIDERTNGITTMYNQDSQDRTSAIYREHDNGNQSGSGWMDGQRYIRTESYSYDNNQNLSSITDALGRRTRYTYDSRGNLLTVTDPLNNITTYTYDEDDNLTSVTDPLGNTTTYEYDESGNLIRTISPDNSEMEYTYNNTGQLTSTTDPMGETTTYEYDVFGNLTAVTYPSGDAVTFGYDNIGRRISITNSRGITTARYTYDNLDRVTEIRYPDDTTTRYIYTCCKLGEVIDRAGNRTVYTYDRLNKLIRVTDAMGRETNYTYDGTGNLSSITDAKGQTTEFSYNKINLLTGITYPDNSAINYVYDFAGNLITRTDAEGNTTNYSYDNNNNLTRVNYPNDTNITYTYDRLNRPVSVIASDSEVISYTYDNLSRVTSTTTGYKGISYQYDNLGNIVQMTDPENRITTYNYDYRIGKLISIINPLNQVTTYEYSQDSSLNLLRSTHANTTYTEYTYDDQDRLTGITNRMGNGDIISSFAYQYYPSQMISRITLDDGSYIDYTYDNIYQLTNETKRNVLDEIIYSNSWTYDAVGNRLTQTKDGVTEYYHYNNRNQLTYISNEPNPSGSRIVDITGTITDNLSPIREFTINDIVPQINGNSFTLPNVTINAGENVFRVGVTDMANNTKTYTKSLFYNVEKGFSYDANGNMISIVDENAAKYLSYDYENHLVSVTSGVQNFSFAYDVLGRRIQKTVNDTVTKYFYNNEDIIAEYDGANVLQTKYTHGSGIDNPISKITNGQSYYYHSNHQGSITELTDSAQQIANAYQYDAYGNIINQTGTVPSPYTYTAREWDNETQLYYYRARYYDAGVGRFISADPAGYDSIDEVLLSTLPNTLEGILYYFENTEIRFITNYGQNLNIYNYVVNNPLNYTDPSGETILGPLGRKIFKWLLRRIGFKIGRSGGGLGCDDQFPDKDGDGWGGYPGPDPDDNDPTNPGPVSFNKLG